MTTLTELLTLCRNTLGDLTGGSYEWADAQLTAWINEALKDMSIHFPVQTEMEISCAAGVHEYDVTKFVIAGILSCEYPAGQDPREYLLRKSYTDPAFWINDGYYDYLPRTTTDTSHPSQLYISNSPTGASQSIILEILEPHNALVLGADVTSLPDQLHNLLTLFVRWKAWQEMATGEGVSPDPNRILQDEYEINAFRAERAYRKSLDETKKTQSTTALVPLWMDKYDRIY